MSGAVGQGRIAACITLLTEIGSDPPGDGLKADGLRPCEKRCTGEWSAGSVPGETPARLADLKKRASPGIARVGSVLEYMPVAIHFHEGDLPDGLALGDTVAIDCETMGLNPHRDRLCVVQISSGDGNAHVVQIASGQDAAPNVCALVGDPGVLKLFHFGRFDIAAIYQAFGELAAPVYCTKIASKLVRTYTDRHGLKNLLDEILDIDISKHQQMSDWGAESLSQAQVDYAASDVLHLHRLKAALDERLAREGRTELARACFDFLPHRALLDLAGWPETDIFAH